MAWIDSFQTMKCTSPKARKVYTVCNSTFCKNHDRGPFKHLIFFSNFLSFGQSPDCLISRLLWRSTINKDALNNIHVILCKLSKTLEIFRVCRRREGARVSRKIGKNIEGTLMIGNYSRYSFSFEFIFSPLWTKVLTVINFVCWVINVFDFVPEKKDHDVAGVCDNKIKDLSPGSS